MRASRKQKSSMNGSGREMSVNAILFAAITFLVLGLGNSLKVSVKNATDINISVNGSVWFANTDAFIVSNGKRLSLGDGTLQVLSSLSSVGRDSIGKYQRIKFAFGLTGQSTILMEGVVTTYMDRNMVIFSQVFPNEVSATSTGDKNSICTGFPSMYVTNEDDLGFLAYGGIMFGDTRKVVGRWKKDSKSIVSGLDSGPIIFFNEFGASTVVSSFSNFMAGSTVYQTGHGNNTLVSWGLLGMAQKIPKDFEYSVIFVTADGINKAIDIWGETLRRVYKRDTSYRDSDLTLNYLGYWTDNGAYYYYHTEVGKSYEDTIVDVVTSAKKQGIPYRYIQYDSWWYPKGPDNGVVEWTAMSSIFPHGLQSLWNQTGWSVAAHNRWWSSKTTYARVNGGEWDFIVENSTTHSIPVDAKFWDFLMKTSKEWGLILYEQDWLNVQFELTSATQTDLTLGRLWLQQMGSGARRNGINIQYCMAPSRHALQSLEIPVVTQARASDDYQPGNFQWKIGVSSLFAEALGVAPSKDCFWTTGVQPGDPYGKNETSPALQSLVATLSTGPVGPADKIGAENVSLIMRTCDADGLILKPSKPARAIDLQLIQTAFNGFSGEVWSTYSFVDSWVFGIIFAAAFSSTDKIVVTPKLAGWGREYPRSMIFSLTNPTYLMDFSTSKPLVLSGCTTANFCLYYTAPVFSMGGKDVILLGELGKWVPISPKRVTDIELGDLDIWVSLRGAFSEIVEFTYMWDSSVHIVQCTMSSSGGAILSVATGVCTPV